MLKTESFRQALIALLIFASATGTGLAQQPASKPQVALSMRVLPIANTTARTRLWQRVDQLSAPTSLTVLAGESVPDAVRRRCGNALDDLVKVAYQKNPGVDPGPVSRDRSLLFIPCPYWYLGKDDRGPVVRVKKGESLKDILPLYTGSASDATIRAVKTMNPGLISADGITTADGTLHVPFVARNLNVPLLPIDSKSSPAVLANDLLPKKNASSVGRRVHPTYSVSPNSYTLVEEADWSSTDPRGDCGGPQVDTDWPVDLAGAASALTDTLSQLPMKPGPGVVLVADTGLDVSDPAVAGELWTNSGVANNLPSVADNFTDDLHGASMVKRNGDIAPSIGYTYAQHGSEVSKVMLQDMPALQNPEHHILVASARLNDDSPPYSIEINTIPSAFSYARQIQADVLNLSVVIGTQDQQLLDALKAANFLVVTAAGNDGAFLDQKSLYPPGFTEPRARMIVVGAHDWKNRLAPFSNRGTLVDILAPGCALPMKKSDGTVELISGTSFAAPYVSRTAALLRAEGLAISFIRTRVLASGDFDAVLAPVTRYGVRLDMPRALRIKQDAVDFNVSDKSIYGELDAFQSWTCNVGGTMRVFYPQTVVKIIPRFPTPAGSVFRVWTRTASPGDFVELTCDAPFTEPLRFKATGSQDFGRYDWNSVNDVVPKVFFKSTPTS